MRSETFLNLNNFIFITIIAIGFVLRIFLLDSVPYGFFADEASIGYNAYSILKHGVDEHGASYPLFFQAFGEFKGPVQIYSTVPFVQLFGLSEFSVRVVSVIYGIMGVVIIFFLARLIASPPLSFVVGFLSAFFLAVSPWHIHFSRVAFELMPYVFFTTLGVFLFLRDYKSFWSIFFSLIAFLLSIYTYTVARMFVPLLVLSLFLIYFDYFFEHKKRVAFYSIFVLFMCLPLFFHFLSGDGFSRWNQVSVFGDNDVNIFSHVIKNYISHFSLQFLFLDGDIGMEGQFITRHSVKDMGELYLFQLPLVLVGIYFLIRNFSRKYFVLFMWFFLYPIGSVFTSDVSAQATRSIIGVVPFQIFSAFGVVQLLYTCKNKLFRTFVCSLFFTVILFSIYDYTQKYFVFYPLYSSDFWGWQYGSGEIVNYFSDHQKTYDQTIMEGAFNGAHIFFDFYAADNCPRCMLGFPHERFDPQLRQLFAVTPFYFESHPSILINVQKYIYYPDGTVAFVIGEVIE